MRCLSSIEVRSSRRRYFFHAKNTVEEHRFVRNRPGEVFLACIRRESQKLTICLCHTVLQRSLIEHIGREFRKRWVHPILHLQPNRANPDQNQSFEKRLCQSSLCSCLTHDNRTKLTVVTNKHYLLCAGSYRNQSFSLDGLCSFVYQDLSKPKILQTWITSPHARTANDISGLKNFPFGAVSERTVFLLIAITKFANLVFETL
mmetsp:Transcript_13882/g.20327  ORF Transcript_13882/g.20327 Transcript_13882/m.20327 type:complete len:203 (-) Transcript_13882:1283-1891(-)